MHDDFRQELLSPSYDICGFVVTLFQILKFQIPQVEITPSVHFLRDDYMPKLYEAMNNFKYDTESPTLSKIYGLMRQTVHNVQNMIRTLRMVPLSYLEHDIDRTIQIKFVTALYKRPSYHDFLKAVNYDVRRDMLPSTLQINQPANPHMEEDTILLEDSSSSQSLPKSSKPFSLKVLKDSIKIPTPPLTPETPEDRKRKLRDKLNKALNIEKKLEKSRKAAEERSKSPRKWDMEDKDVKKNFTNVERSTWKDTKEIKEKEEIVKIKLEEIKQVLNKTEEEILEKPEKMRIFYTASCEYSMKQVMELIVGNFQYFKVNQEGWDTESFLLYHINNLFPRSSSEYKILCRNYRPHLLLFQQILKKITKNRIQIFGLQKKFDTNDIKDLLYELWDGEEKFKKYVRHALYYYNPEIITIISEVIESILNKFLFELDLPLKPCSELTKMRKIPCVSEGQTNTELENKRLTNFKEAIDIIEEIINHINISQIETNKKPKMKGHMHIIDYSVPATFWVILEKNGKWPQEAPEYVSSSKKKILMVLAGAAVLGLTAATFLASYAYEGGPQYQLPPKVDIPIVDYYVDPSKIHYMTPENTDNDSENKSGLLKTAANYAAETVMGLVMRNLNLFPDERAEQNDISRLKMSAWKAMHKVEQLRNVKVMRS